MFGDSQVFASQGVSFGASQTQASTQQPQAKKQRPEENHTCLPVTVRQMECALAKRAGSGEELKFYGSEPKELILVAAVESVARQGTCLEMVLNDSTGRMKARYFVTDAKPDELERVVPGCYVSVFGGVRSAPAVHFAVNGLKLVESADEVSYHQIEVAHSALRLLQPGQAHAEEEKKEVAAPLIPSPQKPPKTEPPAAAPAAAAGPLQGAKLREALMGMFREIDNPEGAAVGDMAAKCGAAEADVRAAIAEMVDGGDVFQTLDEDHFAMLG